VGRKNSETREDSTGGVWWERGEDSSAVANGEVCLHCSLRGGKEREIFHGVQRENEREGGKITSVREKRGEGSNPVFWKEKMFHPYSHYRKGKRENL